MELNNIRFPRLIPTDSIKSHSEWLKKAENYLFSRGYERFEENYAGEDFFYLKNEGDRQLVVLFYNLARMNKYNGGNTDGWGIEFKCNLLHDDLLTMNVISNVSLEKFEEMADKFYNAFK